MGPDIARIEKWAQIFKHPTELFQVLLNNTIKNLPAVQADAAKLVQNFKAGSYFLAGENMADILILELGPVPKALLDVDLQPQDVVRMLAGMIEGLVETDHLDHI